MWVTFADAKANHIFFSKNISINAIFNDQYFNDMLTNCIVSFEQLSPGHVQDVLCTALMILISSFTVLIGTLYIQIHIIDVKMAIMRCVQSYR